MRDDAFEGAECKVEFVLAARPNARLGRARVFIEHGIRTCALYLPRCRNPIPACRVASPWVPDRSRSTDPTRTIVFLGSVVVVGPGCHRWRAGRSLGTSAVARGVGCVPRRRVQGCMGNPAGYPLARALRSRAAIRDLLLVLASAGSGRSAPRRQHRAATAPMAWGRRLWGLRRNCAIFFAQHDEVHRRPHHERPRTPARLTPWPR